MIRTLQVLEQGIAGALEHVFSIQLTDLMIKAREQVTLHGLDKLARHKSSLLKRIFQPWKIVYIDE